MTNLPRYGVQWNGPRQPIATRMDDGYWTPFHLAEEALQGTIPRPDASEIRGALYEALRDYFISVDCPDDQAKRDADNIAEWLMPAVCDAVFPEEGDNGQ